MQTKHRLQVKNNSLNYLLHLPKGLERNSEKEWPLILFLHGAGERGEDLDLVKVHGIARIVDSDEEFPFITISPQCAVDSYWPKEVDRLSLLLDKIIEEYPVDTNRIYLTGLSMGGIGAWHLAFMYPERFAAIIPICGAISLPSKRKSEINLPEVTDDFIRNIARLKDLPIWAFHGDMDDIVPMDETVKLIQLLQEAGAEAKLTIYKGIGHDSWTKTYNDPEIFDWLLQHQRN